MHHQRRMTFSEERRGKTAVTHDDCLHVMLRELSNRKLLISLTVKAQQGFRDYAVGEQEEFRLLLLKHKDSSRYKHLYSKGMNP
ncbi:hypothetical protein TNCV_1947231 [Trichonephila clavipes]|nr:hypothetical protein TNCV_1947231 [Trichonephila clavipes]